MDNTNANQAEVLSIFETVDKRSKNFVDNVQLAQAFTRMALLRDTSEFLTEPVMCVHMTEPQDAKDPAGQEAKRYYVIWEEGENKQLFGAWFFSYTDEDGYPDSSEVVYPEMIATVRKKSHQIVEDIYYSERLNLPMAWVTYHNAQ